MTVKEAINFGEMWLDMNEDAQDSRTYSFFERALEALKVTPCEDVVSRQGVAQVLLKYAHSTEGKTFAEFLVSQINALPPIIPKQRWIPVDYDRYPETYPNAFQEVWIVDADGMVQHKAYDGTRNIKAWMPYIIPEPYKERENG